MSQFDEESWIESVVGGARNAGTWRATAERLKRASDVLRELWLKEVRALPFLIAETERCIRSGEDVPEPDPPVGEAAMLLAGFALENLLKGIIVAADPSEVASGQDKVIDWGTKGHELVAVSAGAVG